MSAKRYPEEFKLAAALLGDSTEFSIGNSQDNTLGKINLDDLFNELYQGQLWVDRFSEACV